MFALRGFGFMFYVVGYVCVCFVLVVVCYCLYWMACLFDLVVLYCGFYFYLIVAFHLLRYVCFTISELFELGCEWLLA